MYNETVIPIKSDGQLHRREPPKAPPPKPAAPKKGLLPLKGISSEHLLILVIAYLVLQSDKPDYLLLMALAYILL